MDAGHRQQRGEPEQAERHQRGRQQPAGAHPGHHRERGERRQRDGREHAVRRAPAGGAGDDREAGACDREERRQACPRTHQKPRVSVSLRRRSRSGRALVTYGTLSKFQGGGGDVVYHSSVSAIHGSLPARAPTRDERITL